MPNGRKDPFIEPTDQFMMTMLRMSLQRALVGAVPPSLRAVTFGWAGTEVQIRHIFDGPIDPDEHEDILCVGAEVTADFPSPWTIDEQVVRVDRPESLTPHLLRAWAYMRREAPLQAKQETTSATDHAKETG